MDQDEQAHLERLRAAHQRRLRELEKQAAAFGVNTPAEIRVEIAQIRANLGIVEAVQSSPISQEMLQEIGTTGQFQALQYQLNLFRQEIHGALRAIDERFDVDKEQRIERQRWLDATLITIGRTLAVVVIILIALVMYTALSR